MSSLPPDPYKVLGVTKDAQIPEIRSAHRKLILKCHPDKIQDEALRTKKQEEFQSVQQAYELLSDETERQKYDDKVRLNELRKQYQNKPNTSSPRSTSKYGGEFADIRTAEPRSTSYKQGPPPPPTGMKQSHSFPRSWEESYSRSPQSSYPEADVRSPRRETSYTKEDRPSKRESEREREAREKDKERERRRAKKEREAEDIRRAEKAEKERKKEDKRVREKARAKEIKRGTEEKRGVPYMDMLDDDSPPPRFEKKSSSSRKYDEPRERSAHREDYPESAYHGAESGSLKAVFAQAYINKSRGGVTRSRTYHVTQPPAAPTPPPASNAGPFAPPEEIRRSAARTRRGSADGPGMHRERPYHHASSREPLNDDDEDELPIPMSSSPRHAANYPPHAKSSPPRSMPIRNNSMPVNPSAPDGYTRKLPIPKMSRAATYDFGDSMDSRGNRGRDRSRLHPQVLEETDSEEEAALEAQRREKDRKSRSSRKTRSPEQSSDRDRMTRYRVDSKTNRSTAYHGDEYHHYPDGVRSFDPRRPSMPSRETTYSTSSHYPNVRTGKMYGHDDVSYSNYPAYATTPAYA